MNTERVYYNDTYQLRHNANIVATGKDNLGYYVILDQTIFHPQGGGQPSDSGTIIVQDINVPVCEVKTIEDDIRHYVNIDLSAQMGGLITMLIDEEKRMLNAKLHTAGHLISHVIEKYCPDLINVKGQHFPGQSYVKFVSKSNKPINISVETINNELEKYIDLAWSLSTKLEYRDNLLQLNPDLHLAQIPKVQPIRIVSIGEFPFLPCGGTHVKNLRELRGMEITKLKIKNNTFKVNYHIKR